MKKIIIALILMSQVSFVFAWNYEQYRKDLGYYYAERQYANSGYKTQVPTPIPRIRRSSRYRDDYYRYEDRNRYRYDDRDIWWEYQDAVTPVKENKYQRNEYYKKSPRYSEPIPIVSSINKYEMETGWIKFEVTPETANVFVDEKYIGLAKKYNGYPEQYVSLIGTRKIVIRSPGYKEAIFLTGVETECRTLIQVDLEIDPNWDESSGRKKEPIPDIEGNVALRIK